ncbi:MAG: ATP-dependent DNA helicase RecG [Luteolibacter sp.]
MVPASQPLSETSLLKGSEVIALAGAGILTGRDALDWLPRRYEDRRRFDAFPSQATAQAVCLRGEVIDASVRHLGPGRRFFEAVVQDDRGGVFGSGKITCRWFNMPYIQQMVLAGHGLVLYGKLKESGGRLVMDHPEFEVLRDEAESIHVERIVPVYKNISGIPQRRLREILFMLLQQLDLSQEQTDLGEPLPGLFRKVHFPEALDDATSARRGFAREEFFRLQLNVVWRRMRYQEKSGRVLGKKTTLLKAFYESLPFDLTGAQKRSIKEIVADMRSELPMNRLLQGDVGAGKTFVAMAAMLLAVDSGCQAALMAPTQILAEQHYLTFCKWLQPLGVRLALKTASRDETSHLAMEGEPQILIGTHALLQDSFSFRDLGLVVIDEQHKFGVTQRAGLIRQGITPDVLVMTATPIPRTLTMTIYGDLDVSLLDEKPPGRGKIVTAVRVVPKQTEVTKFVREQLEEGRQAYLVYPLVEEGSSVKAESATEALEKWRKRLLKFEVGMIHGKLKPEEKESIMARFRNGEIAALVSTTVIEVGVDVPNATVMLIHHAERYGLAQLHQLRGRIGRGGHKGYCVLLTDAKDPVVLDKLKELERSSDGFQIAEADLKLRGPGDVLGTMQSGLGDLKFVDFLSDIELLREARALAEEVLSEDPELSCKHAALRTRITAEEERSGSHRLA